MGSAAIYDKNPILSALFENIIPILVEDFLVHVRMHVYIPYFHNSPAGSLMFI
jgi:hypothetical protein